MIPTDSKPDNNKKQKIKSVCFILKAYIPALRTRDPFARASSCADQLLL